MESLGKDLAGAKAAKQLAAERVLKANETAENLSKEVDTERESSVALKAQVELLTKHLEDAKAVGLATAEVYVGALGQFGGATSSLPKEPSTLNILAWLKSNFAMRTDFVGRVVDFGALASATNFSKMLKQDGYSHVEGLEEDLEGPTELGVTS